MRLESLSLADFRNFVAEPSSPKNAEAGENPDEHQPKRGLMIEFSPRFTVLHGQNGAGKTNVLEAIYLVSTLRSFRSSDLKTLLRRGCDQARIELRAYDPSLDLSTVFEVRIDRGPRSTRRSARLDGKLIRSAADFYGRIQAVLFTPEDLNVLRGSPSTRRQFLDRVLFGRERAHITDIQDYEKLLRSRNKVLKDEDLDRARREQLLDTYDLSLADVGARIWTRRFELLEALRNPFSTAFEQIHGPELPASLEYRSHLGDAPAELRREALLEGLLASREKDRMRGVTGVGPHRDDMELRLDGERASDFASQGQTRALILAFKIAELREAKALRGTPPLLLLDDVSSELDPRRTAQLFEMLGEEVGQCILTTTAADFIRLSSGVQRRDLELQGGRLISSSTLVEKTAKS